MTQAGASVRLAGRRRGDRREADGAGLAVFAAAASVDANTRRSVEWAREAEARGAGEILLTSIDRDGTRAGSTAS